MRSRRLSITITPRADAMLEALLATGLWGRTKAEVAQRLVYQKLQEIAKPERIKQESVR